LAQRETFWVTITQSSTYVELCGCPMQPTALITTVGPPRVQKDMPLARAKWRRSYSCRTSRGHWAIRWTRNSESYAALHCRAGGLHVIGLGDFQLSSGLYFKENLKLFDSADFIALLTQHLSARRPVDPMDCGRCCPGCRTTPMRILAIITDPEEVKKILRHLVKTGRGRDARDRAPPAQIRT